MSLAPKLAFHDLDDEALRILAEPKEGEAAFSPACRSAVLEALQGLRAHAAVVAAAVASASDRDPDESFAP